MGKALSKGKNLHDSFSCKPQATNVDEMNVSVLVPNEDGAHISILAFDKKPVKFFYEDAKTMVEIVERGYRISGDGQCVGWRSSPSEYSWLSYSEFIEKSKNFGSGLVHIGANLGQETLIGIYGKNSVEWAISEFGCLYYSSPIVPLYDSLGPGACRFMINQGEIKLVICDEEKKVKCLLEEIEEIPSLKVIICISDLSDAVKVLGQEKKISLYTFKNVLSLGKLNPYPQKRPQPSDVAEICYTSGTTGDPKGAILTHENWVSAINAYIVEAGSSAVTKSDITLSYLPLAHVFQQGIDLASFFVGGSIGYYSGDVNKLLEDMRVLKPTIFPAVPRLLNKFYDIAQAKIAKEETNTGRKISGVETGKYCNNELSDCSKFFSEILGGNIRCIMSAAAPISDVVLKFYRRVLGCYVVEVYGQTETTAPCTLNIVTDQSFGHAGVPLPCNMVKLISVPELGYFTENGTGEICVKGFNVVKGYYKDPEQTAETIDKDGWLHTGDVGMWTSNGCLKIIDRIKHILKLSQGEYVSPAKIENIYLSSAFIAQIFVHVDSFQSHLVAIVIPDQDVVMPWCKKIPNINSWEDVCKHPAVKKLILDDMQKLALDSGLMTYEQVKKIHLHPKPLTLEDGLLTPTFKTKRSICAKYFAKEIQKLYSENCF